MKIADTNLAFNHQITEGAEYQWQCFPNGRFLDYESEYAHGSVVFDVQTQRVYSAEVNDKEDKFRYRWVDPEYIQAYRDESKERNVDPDQAWDDRKWTNLDVEEDFLEKAEALFAGKEFDTRVQIPVEFDDELLMTLFKKAHERDITFNQLVEEALTELLEEFKRDPEGVRARMDSRI